jgi:hypothetical protein
MRATLAVLVSAAVDLTIWSQHSTHLGWPVNSIGYPSFNNYDYLPPLLAYRLETWAFPLGVIIVYLLLDRFGPLRSPITPDRSMPVPLLVDEAAPSARSRRLEPTDFARLAAPLFLIAISVRSHIPPPAGDVLGPRVLAIAAYLVLVVLGARAVREFDRRRSGVWSLADCFCIASAGLEAVVAFACLWLVSHRTSVILPNGTLKIWSWIPWWFPVVGIAASATWIGRRLAAGARPEDVERLVRCVVVGSAVVYLVTAVIPGPIGSFTGFDDAQSLVGASFVQHGLFPWRDFQLIHGPFPDILQSLIGFQLFQPTAWGMAAGIDLVVNPLAWVCFYLLGVWVTRGRSVIVLAIVVVAASGWLGLDPRLFPLPLVLILLGQALRSERRGWTIALTLAMFAEGVLVPETGVQVLSVGLVVVVSDFVHRDREANLLAGFRRTRTMVVTGVAVLAVWFAFLATQAALVPFLQWFAIFLPGHVATGADPPSASQGVVRVFDLMIVLVGLTLLSAGWRIIGRRPWTPRAWMAVAAALNAGVYGEQALMRPDSPHYMLSLEAGIPLFIIVLMSVVQAIDRRHGLVIGLEHGRPNQVIRFGSLAMFGIIALLLATPNGLRSLWTSPQRTTEQMGPLMAHSPLGYAAPTALPPGMLSDLRTIVHTYALHSTVYDMTAAPGVFYYLLGLRSPSVLTNITQADTSNSLPSNMIIDDLRRSRPALVAFTDQAVGLPVYDGILNEVRDNIVSQYVLDHYTPVLEADTFLFLVRNDLASNRPAVPKLSSAPVTSDLYNSQGSCAWGYTAAYLQSPQVGRRVTVPVTGTEMRPVSVRGWAYDSQAHRPASAVVVAIGNRGMFTLPTGGTRADVSAALRTPTANLTGFDGNGVTVAGGPITVYEVGQDGRLHLLPMAGSWPASNVTAVRLPNGATRRVGGRGRGNVDGATTGSARVSSFQVPPGISLKSARLLTFNAASAFGNDQLSLADAPVFNEQANSADITAGTLPVVGRHLPVRVGACLQWHGYTHRTLYVEQTGGPQLVSLTLSGVSNP